MRKINVIIGIKQIMVKVLAFCIFASCLAVSSAHAQGIKKEVVKFEEGKFSTIIENSLKGEQTVDYTVNVKKGQSLNVSMATDNTANYFNIMEPEEEYVAIFNGSVEDNMFEDELQETGDYTIRVYLMRSAARRNEKANYKLEIIVSNPGQED
ncbi:DNA breaking-rejoining protein [Tamlana haliotis]|uniref:DNA breaking-rejoining protein n=1 Tax=Pseudotamlana haliotis TaxID=2614804 RepID=A0A6N6MMB2_9FLAO|nr:DNA breaking-rejoining protein [Tamlana haliotis]KAB1069443.1 DNA breaking-rejoining protein [Tamlana haliotis]